MLSFIDYWHAMTNEWRVVALTEKRSVKEAGKLLKFVHKYLFWFSKLHTQREIFLVADRK